MAWKSGPPPKDGTVFLTYYGDVPVFAVWLDSFDLGGYVTKRYWFFRRQVYETRRIAAGGYRVVTWVEREKTWGIAAQFPPFEPRFWQFIQPPPWEDRKRLDCSHEVHKNKVDKGFHDRPSADRP